MKDKQLPLWGLLLLNILCWALAFLIVALPMIWFHAPTWAWYGAWAILGALYWEFATVKMKLDGYK